ncbi:MAG TPA: SpoIIE family protein phosphatase [Solirubrobacteraceae bacterium]|nr:SpoIIE family protein phosphatase [Solirubrobacteraceae bacterium]
MSPAGNRRAITLATGVSIAGALALLDIVVGSSLVLVGLVVFAPLVSALFGHPRDVALVGVVAVALVLLSALWNDNFGSGAYIQRIAVGCAMSALAVLIARNRLRIASDRERFAVLSAIAEVADGTRTLENTVAAINDVLVPTVADICIVDAVNGGDVRRLAVRAAGADNEQLTAMLAARPPLDAGNTRIPPQPFLAERIDDDLLRGLATDAADLDRLRAMNARCVIVVPLSARGRRLGALTLLRTGGSAGTYGARDLDFAKVLAGRVALALDNAGLFSELETIEAQLTVVLATLAEAVTVQLPGGGLLYANEAAAQMLGYASAHELLGTPITDVVAALEPAHEDGSPVQLDDLPGRRILAGERGPRPLVLRTVDARNGAVQWRVTKASGVYDSAGDVKLVVNVIEDVTEVKRAELAQRMLARAGELLASSLDHERMLQQVAELAVPELADWCAVSLPDGHGAIRTVAVAHADPAKVAFARRIAERYPSRADGRGGAAQVLRDGVAQVANEVSERMLAAAAQDEQHLELLLEVGMRAALIVPMTAGGGTIVGALTLISAESGRQFGEADVALAEELARRAGTAVENARLYTERSGIARTLQTSLLPGRLPRMPGWATATLYRPAGDENWVGGDFYDAFEVRGGWLAIVGDVAGQGAAAAALTGLARHTLRTAAALLDDPLDALRTLNDELLARDEMALCSVAAVLLRDGEAGAAVADVICAGHPQPLLVRAGGVRGVGTFSPMLGAYKIGAWERSRVVLEPGDLLVLFTDGVFDSVGEDERFGEERLAQTVAGATEAADAVARIDAALSAFAVGPQADDTAVLAVERIALAAIAGHH